MTLGFFADLLGFALGSALDPILWIIAAAVAFRLKPVWFPVAALAWAVVLGLLLPLPDFMVHGHLGRGLAAYAILWLAHGGWALYRRSQRAKPASAIGH